MRKYLLQALCGAAFLFLTSAAQAQGTIVLDEQSKPTEQQNAFVASMLDAARQDGYDALWATVHPDSLNCLSDDFKAITEMMNFQDLKDEPVPPGHMIQTNELLEEDVKGFFTMMFGEDVTVPVTPTHSLSIHYKKQNGRCGEVNVTKIIYVAEKDGQWFEAMPCPGELPYNAEELKAKMADHDKKVEEAFAALPEEKKQAYRKLVSDDGQKYAVVKAMIAEGQDMALARDVADKFCAEPGAE